MLRNGAHYRRTTIAGAVSALLVVGAAAVSAVTAAADDTTPFSNGTAKATALVARFGPGVGSLQLGITEGVAVSQVTNDLAQAQAQSLDFGLIGTSITADRCNGDPAFVKPEDLPQPTRVDNRQGDTAAARDEWPVAGRTFGAGRMEATATKQPSARAVALGSASEFGPVLTIGGGRAEAVSQVVDGTAREAHATVEASIDIAGIVQLRDMKWDALHRTGADPAAEGAFAIGDASAMAIPLSVDQLGALETTVNTALAPSGIRVEFPHIERFEEPADLIRVTPLRIVLEDSPAGKATLGAALNLTRQQREQLFDTLAAAVCDTAAVLLVGDISLSVLAGTGFFAVEVGGAEATTAELTFESPFGSIGPAPVVPPELPVSGVVSPTIATGPVSAPAPATGGTAPPRPAAAVGPLERVCESVHQFRWPSCSHGAAAPLGLLGLGATAGVAALDWRHQRRRRPAPAAS